MGSTGGHDSNKGDLALRFSLGVLGWVDSGPFSNPDIRSELILDFDLGTWLVSAVLLVGYRKNRWVFPVLGVQGELWSSFTYIYIYTWPNSGRVQADLGSAVFVMVL